MIKEPHQVHMLPAESIRLLKSRTIGSNNLILFEKEQKTDALFLSQYLYIISNEQIKDGDWYIYKHFGEWVQPSKFRASDGINTVENLNKAPRFFYKIVATTNPELWSKGIAKIDISFVEVFAKEYNKGNIIKEVMLEYEIDRCGQTCKGCEEPSWCINIAECEQNETKDTRASGVGFKFWKEDKLKLRNNGSVIVHPVKDTSAREIIQELISRIKVVAITTFGSEAENTRIAINKAQEWLSQNPK